MKKSKVIVLGTGNVSSYAVRAICKREDMELVGVWTTAFSAYDVGVDAGMLRYCDQQPTGIIVTDDLDSLLAQKPDCAMMGLNCDGGLEGLVNLCTPIAAQCLRAGVNVVGTSLLPLMWPETSSFTEAVKTIQDACAEGNSSFYMSGNHPGFACDFIPAVMLTGANRIDTINAVEVMNYSMAPNEFEMKEGRGFGMPTDFKARAEDPNFIIGTWGPCVDYIAHALGYKCEGYVTSYDKALTDHDVQVAYGVIPAGTVGAVRLTVSGIINGRPAITVGSVNRMSEDCAPDWQRGSAPGVYVIDVKGEPSMRCEYGYDQSIAYGYSIVALRALNAINAVVDAKPGMLSSLDIPYTLPQKTID